MSGDLTTIEDFEKLDIRVGRVIEIQPFPEGRYSTHILLVDFGKEIGTKKSLAKLAPNYESSEVVVGSVLCVVNFQLGRLPSTSPKS